MTLTKQDIDALVDGMCPVTDAEVVIAGKRLFSNDVRRALRLAAGLSATGERKPERVRCWLVAGSGSAAFWAYHPDEMNEQVPKGASVTPGWFVPSEEGET